MNRYGFLFTLIFCLTVSTTAFSIEGFPGSTWGELRWELPKRGKDNLMLNGWIEQGITWKKWENIRLDTYATIRYKLDTEQLDWNNSLGPGLGMGITFFAPKGDNIKLGVEYIWDRFYKTNRTDEKAVAYMRWYGWWDLLRKKP